MDIKEKSINLCSGGTFNSPNTLFGKPQEIFSTTGHLRSGKLIDLTVISSGVNSKPKLDLLFFPDKIEIEEIVGSGLRIPYKSLQMCSGRVSILREDYSLVSECNIANLFNINLTFQYKSMYIVPVYQDTNPCSFTNDSVTLNIGYELGVCG